MSPPVLQIVIASTRPGRVGPAVGGWLSSRAEAHGGFEVELVDLAEVALPFLDEPHHPRLGQYVHDHTKAWSATVDRADAFVFVTPEYNHGYNAVLKNAIDFLHAEWSDKPVGFCAYGGVSAGTRAAQALKQVVTAVRMVPVFDGVYIPFVAGLIGDDGSFAASESLDDAADRMFDELARLGSRLRDGTPTR